MKKVGVILSVFNAESYIAEALDSVLTQDYKETYIYLYDDGSTDGTLEILESYKNQHQNIRSLDKGKTNKGAAYGYNAAAEAAIKDSADFVQIMSADDVMSPDMVSSMVSAYKAGDGFVTPSIEFFGAQSAVHHVAEDITYESQLVKNQVVGHLLVPADVWEALGGLDEKTYTQYTPSSFEDYDFATRALKDFTYSTVQQPVIKYRTHADQSSKTMETFRDKLRAAFDKKFSNYKGLEKVSKNNESNNDRSEQLQQKPVRKSKSAKSTKKSTKK